MRGLESRELPHELSTHPPTFRKDCQLLMLIADFTVDHPILRETMAEVPDLKLQREHSFEEADGTRRAMGWVETTDFEAFEAAVADDPTVANLTLLADVEDRRLYRLDFTEVAEETRLYPQVVAVGGVFREFVGSADGWQFRIQFPNREALEQTHTFCRENGFDMTLHQVYDEVNGDDSESHSLTDPQRETLLEAVESGYLDIPRELTLAELGGRLGVSESAASERFRRGVKSLVEEELWAESA